MKTVPIANYERGQTTIYFILKCLLNPRYYVSNKIFDCNLTLLGKRILKNKKFNNFIQVLFQEKVHCHI